jgi:hypothetical protein
VSVFRDLLFARPTAELPAARVTPDHRDPSELLSCLFQVRSLFWDLGTKTCELLGIPPHEGTRGELSSRWEDFSNRWLREWEVVGARCAFHELSETQMGVAYGRISGVHKSLPITRLKYENLLVRFEEEQAAELAQMRRALDLSETALRKRAGGAE